MKEWFILSDLYTLKHLLTHTRTMMMSYFSASNDVWDQARNQLIMCYPSASRSNPWHTLYGLLTSEKYYCVKPVSYMSCIAPPAVTQEFITLLWAAVSQQIFTGTHSVYLFMSSMVKPCYQKNFCKTPPHRRVRACACVCVINKGLPPSGWHALETVNVRLLPTQKATSPEISPPE